MNLDSFLNLCSLPILLYFLGVNAFYLALFSCSFVALVRHQLRARFATPNEILKARITPPVSVLAPAYNEEKSIVASVESLLKLEYGQYEVIVINDGSKDKTLETLKTRFKLRKTAREYHPQIPTQPVRAIYKSDETPNLLVVDKANGGKADSLNAGINISSYPLFCCIDADSVLERQSLVRVVHPFMEAYSDVVATGGLVRIANGCTFRNGEAVDVRTPRRWLVAFQVVEYFRAFLSGRMAFSRFNALLIISGAYGLFKKQAVIDVGGYRHDLVGEDMELVVRLHHERRRQKKPCGLYFVPDPVCWTEAPESLRVLSRQRNRWQRGLSESLAAHLGMLGNPRYGVVGLVAMPYFVLIEWLSPVVEICGYAIFTVGAFRGALDTSAVAAFFLLAVAFGMVLSLLALLMEELAFRRYPQFKDLLRLMAAAVLENVGYRQYMALIRAKGLYDWLRGKKAWGAMERTGLAAPQTAGSKAAP
jgi:cellulose synthase/poly-beta-1,6-N-acetylglucosamine synthase-like glycosyltransferase